MHLLDDLKKQIIFHKSVTTEFEKKLKLKLDGESSAEATLVCFQAATHPDNAFPPNPWSEQRSFLAGTHSSSSPPFSCQTEQANDPRFHERKCLLFLLPFHYQEQQFTTYATQAAAGSHRQNRRHNT